MYVQVLYKYNKYMLLFTVIIAQDIIILTLPYRAPIWKDQLII